LELNAQSENSFCNCKDNFDLVVKTLKQNYPDFYPKANLDSVKFKHLTDSIINKTPSANPLDCIQLLQSWTSFFQDIHHLKIVWNEDDKVKYASRYRSVLDNKAEKTFSKEQITAFLLQTKQSKKETIEGVWEESNHSYQMIIKQDIFDNKKGKEKFTGYILKADSIFYMPGQFKMKVEKGNDLETHKENIAQIYNVQLKDLYKNDKPTTLILNNNNTMTITGEGIFYRVTDLENTKNDRDIFLNNLALNTSTRCIRIDKETMLLSLPDFLYKNAKTIDSLILKYRNEIVNSKFLIIDVRDNMGGSIKPYKEVLPLVYTNPIITPSGSVMASPLTMSRYLNVTFDVKTSLEEKKQARQTLDTLKKYTGKKVTLFASDTIKLNHIFPKPLKVAVLINENTASAAEFFVRDCKQSTKVIVFGSRKGTKGATVSGDMQYFKLPCPLFDFYYPSAVFDWQPAFVRNGKILPDVVIPENTKDWIKFVQMYFRNN
jgi:hypothetical protein